MGTPAPVLGLTLAQILLLDNIFEHLNSDSDSDTDIRSPLLEAVI